MVELLDDLGDHVVDRLAKLEVGDLLGELGGLRVGNRFPAVVEQLIALEGDVPAGAVGNERVGVGAAVLTSLGNLTGLEGWGDPVVRPLLDSELRQKPGADANVVSGGFPDVVDGDEDVGVLLKGELDRIVDRELLGILGDDAGNHGVAGFGQGFGCQGDVFDAVLEAEGIRSGDGHGDRSRGRGGKGRRKGIGGDRVGDERGGRQAGVGDRREVGEGIRSGIKACGGLRGIGGDRGHHRGALHRLV